MLNEKKKIVFEKNHEEWSKIFKEEAFKIHQITGIKLEDIHHIGSTSILNIISKPVIDILIVSNDLDILKKLEKYEYIHRLNIKIGHPFLSKKAPFDFHLHLFNSYDKEVDKMIKFRDWMIENEEDRSKYAELKQSLANMENASEADEKNGVNKYANMKGKFVQEILEKTKTKN